MLCLRLGTIQRMMVNLFGRYALLASDAASEEPLDATPTCWTFRPTP